MVNLFCAFAWCFSFVSHWLDKNSNPQLRMLGLISACFLAIVSLTISVSPVFVFISGLNLVVTSLILLNNEDII